jgi:hypothetical protein
MPLLSWARGRSASRTTPESRNCDGAAIIGTATLLG